MQNARTLFLYKYAWLSELVAHHVLVSNIWLMHKIQSTVSSFHKTPPKYNTANTKLFFKVFYWTLLWWEKKWLYFVKACVTKILTVSLPKNMTTGVHNSVKDPWRGFPESIPIDMENQVKERSRVLSCVIPTGADLVTAILSKKKLLLFSWIPQSSFLNFNFY